MPPALPLHFGPYRLEGPQGPLWHHAEIVAVPPKALAVLWLLARQAGQVVSKATLLDTVWAETVVSEGTLTTCLSLLRQALGEDAQQPRYIATVHRVGYRFVAPVTQAGPPPALASLPAPRGRGAAPAAPRLVGRAAELAQLHAGFAQARQGTRQLVFVTGEAGMGKTTLVEAFVAEVAAAQTAWIGWGQCIDHSGAGEAYLPLLDALGRLGRGAAGAHLVACVRQYAPTWLGPLAAVVGEETRAAGVPPGPGGTPQRRLRELAEALEACTAAHPLLLVLEDLHWSDAATVEALTLLARRREAARLLVLGTYRPVELILRQHPLKAGKQELQLHGHCADVPLGYLPVAAVQAYLAQRGPAAAATAEWAAWVHRRTEGQPLFMVHVVEELARGGRLTAAPEAAGRGAAAAVPAGLKQLIELQLEQLGTEEQQVLEVASVVGAEFAEVSVAAGLPLPLDAIAARCEGLAQRGQFIEDRGLAAWPDGTVSGRYGFRHALYQEVLYRRLGSGRRMRCHRAIGMRLEEAYRARTHEVAAELALQLTLAVALSEVKGQAAPEVDQTYARIRALGAQVGETPQLVQMLLGLHWFHLTREALSTAREAGEQLAQLAQRAARPADLLTAHSALGFTAFLLGDYGSAQTHCAQGIALIDPPTQRAQAVRYGYAPGVFCLSTAANTLWCLGFPARAGQRSQEALALAQALEHPRSLAFVHLLAIYLHQRRREVRAAQGQAEALLTLATAQGFPQYVGYGTFWRGWALTRQGQQAAGLVQMHQGLDALVALESLVARPLCLVWLAEATGQAGDIDAGLRLLAEALEACATSGRGDGLAEAYRLKGELLLQAGGVSPASGAARRLPQAAEAEACFQQALSIARRQQAKAWELRAATSLARLWQRQGKRDDARALLAPLYGWFTEGFDTADLQEAKALLEALA